MPGGQIKINAFSDNANDGSLQYSLYICNNVSSTYIYFYDFADCFRDIGYALMNFPQQPDDSINFEIGTDDDQSDYYIALQFFCFGEPGKCAIHVVIDNHQPDPDYCRSEFYITAEPDSLNKLGKMLNEWDPKAINEIVWNAEQLLNC